MFGEGFLLTFVVGLVVGGLAERFGKAGLGYVLSLVLGITGSVIGGLLLRSVGVFADGWINSYIGAIVGAAAVIYGYRLNWRRVRR